MFFKGEIPFVRLLIPLIIGIAAGLFLAGIIALKWSGAGAGLSLALFVTLLIFYKRLNLYRFRWLPGTLVQTFVLFTGFHLTIRSAEKYNADYFSNFPSDALIVTVKNEPQLSGDILRFESTVEQVITRQTAKSVSGKLLVALKSDSLKPLALAYGDRLMIPSHYNEVDPPFNPQEFNFKEYLAGKQIYQQTFINQHQVKVLSRNQADKIIAFALKLRKQLVDKFYLYLPDKEAAALASTLILGYRANLSKEIISAYSKTGTMHILSVSGMHVGIVFIVLNFLLRPLRRTPGLRYASAIIIISSIWFYALITGFSPSVCRAAMMLSFVVLGKTLNKNLNTYNLLAISAFFLLIYNPYNLLDVGFQLSYLAVIGLVYLHPKIYHTLYLKNKILDYAWSYSALSISAQLATFPISLYYFHQFPVYFLISNLVVVLPVALIMYAGILFLFVPWPVLLIPLGSLLNALISYTNKILFYIEALPFASISSIWINTYQYILIYLIIACMIWAGLSAKKMAVYFCVGFIFLFAISVSRKVVKDNQNEELIFYSLRKNSALAYINNGQAYLISDLLNDEKTIAFSINPAIESRGISEFKKINRSGSFTDPAVKALPGYIQLGNFRVFRWDKQMDNLNFNRILKSDVILLSGNPKINVRKLRDNAKFSMLLIDATNFDYRIKQWKAEAESLKIPVRILKKSPAYVVKF